MPLLDVTDILFDPDFCEIVSLIRRAQVVGNNGVASITTTTSTITAVVTAQNGDFIRQSDAEFATNTIMVHTQTQLRGVTTDNYPDYVVWNGNNYVVKRSNNFSKFGQGFYAAFCELQEQAEAP